MRRWILVDHSLSNADGHHFEYAVNVLRHAKTLGYQPVLVTNRLFAKRARDLVPRGWLVLPVYRYSSYNRYTVFCQPQATRSVIDPASGFRLSLKGFFGICKKLVRSLANLPGVVRYCYGKWHRKRSFVRASHVWWSTLDPRPGAEDVVFFPTFTEFDLECLAEFLASELSSIHVTWHVQFHFGFLGRRKESFADNRSFQKMREHFRKQLRKIPEHRLRFYTTTDRLASQYNLLEVAPFSALPYPVNPKLAPVADCAVRRPWTISCLGCLRPEKGHSHLSNLLAPLWRKYFQNGKARLMFQTTRGGPVLKPPQGINPQEFQRAISVRPYPLALHEWLDLIHETDIAVFPYDRNRYSDRCSALLLEMLAAGIPVIVPGGCWLGDQIAEYIYHYQQATIDRLRANVLLEHAVCNEQRSMSTVMPLSINAPSYLAAQIWWHEEESDAEARMELRAFDATGCTLGTGAAWLCRRAVKGEPTPALLRLPVGTSQVQLTLRPGSEEGPLAVKRYRLMLLQPPAEDSSIPLGKVGLMFCDPSELPDLVAETLEHVEHYRHTAREVAAHWHAQHHPARTIIALRHQNDRLRSSLQQRAA